MGGGHGHGGPPPGMGQPAALPTAEQIEGPQTPTNFRRLFIIMGDEPQPLTDGQAAQYDTAYQGYMAATATTRDSARATMKALRRAMEDRDFEVLQAEGQRLSRLGKDLNKQDEAFDEKKVKPLLDKKQREIYKDWKQEQKKAAEEEQAHMRPKGPPRPPPDTPPQMP